MPSFYVGMPILIVRMEKFIVCTGCLFSHWDAHIYCENGYPHAYIWRCLYSLDTGDPFHAPSRICVERGEKGYPCYHEETPPDYPTDIGHDEEGVET